MALLIGLLLVALVGVMHHFALRGLDHLSGSERRRPNRSILLIFNGLLLLHTFEILLFAGMYRVLHDWGGLGRFAAHFNNSWSDLIYFSGVNFVTLGYTTIEVEGPLRLINMMQSLGGDSCF